MLLGVTLVGCGEHSLPQAAGPGTVIVRKDTGETLVGNYLAGRFARSERDTQAAAEYFGRALAEDPENPVLLRRTFAALIAAGEVEEALPLAERVLKAEPRDGMAQMTLATAAAQSGDFAAAARLLGPAASGGFNSLLAPIVNAWAAAGMNDTDAALTHLAALSSNAAFGSFQAYHAGLINELGRRNAEAEAEYKKVLSQASGGTVRVVDAYGRLLERQGRSVEARQLYEEYLKRFSASPTVQDSAARLDLGKMPAPLAPNAAAGMAEAFYGAASVLSRDNAGDAVEIYLQLALHLRPDLDAAHMLLADVYENRRRWEDAIAAYREVSPDSPFSQSARLRIAWALSRLERDDEAVATLRGMAAEPGSGTDALVMLAEILRGKEQFAEAARELDRAIERVPAPQERHWGLFYARGIAHERSQQWDKAEADFLKALELRPDEPLVLNYLGYSWVDQGIRLEEARRMIERAVELRPNDGYIVDSLGWALYRLGRYSDAVTHLERAVELQPEDPVINDHLGDVYWRVGRTAEAQFQWGRALGLKPETDQVPLIEKKLQSGLEPPTPPTPKRADRDGG